MSDPGPHKAGGLLKGRLGEAVDGALARASVSVGYDCRLARHDLAGSRAHARMLAKAGLVSGEELAAIESGLDVLARDVDAGRMVWDEALEDVHMNLEKALTDLIGPAGAKLHTARSRNDQVALDERLFLIEASGRVGALLRDLRAALVERASGAGAAPMPGYTHLQRAQPILLAHHLLAYFQMLSRDQQRLADLGPRLAVMPLGSGALAGTGLPILPLEVASELGLSPLAQNSLDAVASRDHLMEFLSFGAILMVHLSRLAEDIVLWCSSEFGFASLPDSLSTTSSMMPQKKNPDGAELMRGKAGRAIGNLVSLLATVKGLPMSYNRDLQEDKEPLFDTVETLELVLPLAAQMVRGLVFDLERLRAAADDPYVAATDLADHLVLKGLPFRQAHAAVGALVARAMARGVPLRDIGAESLREFCPQADPDVLGALDLDSLLAARSSTPGGTAPASVGRQLEEAKRALEIEAAAADLPGKPGA
ncbi:MAG: argininosuccinate lyase [Deltaproteobacteria bacterium]|nr:argininosuccinate lyase [Deltaproteobacteria bacterium]